MASRTNARLDVVTIAVQCVARTTADTGSNKKEL